MWPLESLRRDMSDAEQDALVAAFQQRAEQLMQRPPRAKGKRKRLLVEASGPSVATMPAPPSPSVSSSTTTADGSSLCGVRGARKELAVGGRRRRQAKALRRRDGHHSRRAVLLLGRRSGWRRAERSERLKKQSQRTTKREPRQGTQHKRADSKPTTEQCAGHGLTTGEAVASVTACCGVCNCSCLISWSF